jgi:adenylate cyclase
MKGIPVMEIERKFLIDRFPDNLTLIFEAVVHQGYISVDPVVRIRSMEQAGELDYVLCFKGEGTLVREEIEISITEEKFLALKKLLKAPMIRKDYRVYQLPNGLKLECNLVDKGEPDEFMYAEVEFDTIEHALSFKPPSFLGKDVTEVGSYAMAAYWEKKLSRSKQLNLDNDCINR